MNPGDGLALDAVTISYPAAKGRALVAVRMFKLDLPRGAIGCLLGPSGCGKTTLLRAIAGFEPLQSGSIYLNGTLLSSPHVAVPPERRRVGMMFQDYALFPHLDVNQNIGFGLRRSSKSLRDLRVAEMLELVGLSGMGGRYPHELSGGQQQRISLARALAPAPDLLLLDEPFSNLDVNNRERIAIEVRNILTAAKATALIVTHHADEAQAIGDYIGVMADGMLQNWSAVPRVSSAQLLPPGAVRTGPASYSSVK